MCQAKQVLLGNTLIPAFGAGCTGDFANRVSPGVPMLLGIWTIERGSSFLLDSGLHVHVESSVAFFSTHRDTKGDGQ